MANAQRAIVNQRLYFAKLHISWLEREIADQQVRRSVVEQALGESIVLHLVLAYRAYLNEVAKAYQLTPAEVTSAAHLASLLETSDAASAECQEMLALESGESWLFTLLDGYAALGVEAAAEPVRKDRSLIQVQRVDNNLCSLETLQLIYQQLTALIDTHRQHLEEW